MSYDGCNADSYVVFDRHTPHSCVGLLRLMQRTIALSSNYWFVAQPTALQRLESLRSYDIKRLMLKHLSDIQCS